MRLFKSISLSTPESVELEFTLAGIGSRAFALVIDYHIMGLLLTVFWILWGIFSYGLLSSLERSQENYTAVPIWLAAIATLISFVIFTGYFTFFEVIWHGQTPGKRFAKVRVVRDNGSPIGLSQAALRAVLRPIDDFALIGVFFIILGKQEKRIGDWVAGTLVVQEDRPDPKTSLTISDQARQLAVELPALVDLSQLLPDDLAVIHAYLQRRPRMEPKARNERSMELARQLRTLVGLATVPPNTTADQFLEAIYLAYQQAFNPDQNV